VVADAVAEGLIARSGAKVSEGTEAVGAEEPLPEWERELLGGEAEAAAVEATGGDTDTEETPAAEATGAASEAAEAAEVTEAVAEAPVAPEAVAEAPAEAAAETTDAQA
jgi:small subunit ribosomal protein S2